MLSIAPIAPAAYYREGQRQDYYLGKGELPGVWFGRGAERLGLTGTVRGADFGKLREGFGPDGTKLVRNAGHKHHFPGHDAVLSAPKWLSTLWATHRTAERRAELERAVVESAKEALRKYEGTALYTRVGRGGAIVERAVGLVAALFLQTTSRAGDPQLHVHCTLANALLCQDGEFRTMLGITAKRDQPHRLSRSALYQMKMVLGATFQEALARQVAALGYPVERTREGTFDLPGVPRTLIERFSTRGQDIQKAMAERGTTGARAASLAAKETRPRKSNRPAEERFPEWREVAAGFDPAALRSATPVHVVDNTHTATQGRPRFEEVAGHVRARMLAQPVARHDATAAPEKRARATEVGSARPQASRPVAETGRSTEDERLHRATALASKVLNRSRKDGSHVLAPLNVVLAVKQVEFLRFTRLASADRAALAAITRQRGAVQLLNATTESRVESVLTAARLAWKREGYRVLLATSSRAEADRVEKRTGIHSVSTAGLLSGLKKSRGIVQGYLAAQKKALSVGGFKKASSFIRYAFKAAGKWIRLDEKTIVVVRNPDSMTLPECADLLKRAARAGAKLVFVHEAEEAASRREPGPRVTELLLQSHLRKAFRDSLREREQERSY